MELNLDNLNSLLRDQDITIRGRLQENVLLGPMTWLRVGGAARILFTPADEEDLSAFLSALPCGISVWSIGLASNLLIRDGGLDGVVVRLSARGFSSVEVLDEHCIRAGAALPDKRLAKAALNARIGGFAFYHGIPGSIGGALKMNAGANGSETAERVIEVRAIQHDGAIVTLTHTDMAYEYRYSGAPSNLIFVSGVFQGQTEPVEMIQKAMDDVRMHRERVQPIRERTGGSTFKNPPDYSAWKLIDEAGCRGLSIGGAQISEMHCNFMINTGAATAYDMEYLGETVRRRVRDYSGVALEWEVKRIGSFADHHVEEFLGG